MTGKRDSVFEMMPSKPARHVYLAGGMDSGLSSGVPVVSLGYGQLLRADLEETGRGAANICDANGLARRNTAAVAGHGNLPRAFCWYQRCRRVLQDWEVELNMTLVEAAVLVPQHPAHRILPFWPRRSRDSRSCVPCHGSS